MSRIKEFQKITGIFVSHELCQKHQAPEKEGHCKLRWPWAGLKGFVTHRCHPDGSVCPCGVLYLCAVCLCVCTAPALPAQQAVSLRETEGRRSTRKHSFIWIYFSFYFLIRVAATSSGIQQGLGPQSPSLSHPVSQWTFRSGCPPRPISTSGAVRAQCSVHKTSSHIILGRLLCSFSAAGCRTQPSHCHLGGSRFPLQHHQAGLAVIFPR